MKSLLERRCWVVIAGFFIIALALGVFSLSLLCLRKKVKSASFPFQQLVGEGLRRSQTIELVMPDWSRPVCLVKKVSWDGNFESTTNLYNETILEKGMKASSAEKISSEVKKVYQIASQLVVRNQIELRAVRLREERLRRSYFAATWRKVNGDKAKASWSQIPQPYLLVNFSVRVPAVALTFDDGPHPCYTKQILNILKKEKVHATFFVVGMFAEYYPSILRRIAKEGNELGNHTYTHLNSAKAKRKQLRREIKTTDQLIKKASGHSGRWFRPPGALIDGGALKVVSSLNYQVVLWDVDSLDWQKPKPRELAKRVLRRVKPGSIVLFHDGGGNRSRTVAALPLVIKGLKKRHLKIVTISELVKMVQKEQAINF